MILWTKYFFENSSKFLKVKYLLSYWFQYLSRILLTRNSMTVNNFERQNVSNNSKSYLMLAWILLTDFTIYNVQSQPICILKVFECILCIFWLLSPNSCIYQKEWLYFLLTFTLSENHIKNLKVIILFFANFVLAFFNHLF